MFTFAKLNLILNNSTYANTTDKQHSHFVQTGMEKLAYSVIFES